ncbi:MAG: polyribonucleotide nucleotidyltransferase, partial [bacterium]|nr:polyribonucleotide nucleotidyltransferase [bacterium]
MKLFSVDVGGRTMTLETGRLAKQAGGAVLVSYGGTVVLVASTMSKGPRAGIDFFPLTVEYDERLYSVGKIPGGFLKREGRPSEKATLAARLIDRPLRPLFPEGFLNDVQIVVTVLSVDQDYSQEMAAIAGASAALCISDIPYNSPVAGVVVGLIGDKYFINPTSKQLAESRLHLVVAGTKDAIMMVEAGASEVSEKEMIEAIMIGHQEVKKIVAVIEQMQREVGKAKAIVKLDSVDKELYKSIQTHAEKELLEAIRSQEKLSRERNIDLVVTTTTEHYLQMYPEKKKEISEILQDIVKNAVRGMIINEHERPDGRGLRQVRAVSCDAGVLPRTHGSGLFTRGQTQVLSIVTLGVKSDVQIIDDLSLDETKRYIHHYNFPSYSVGETRPSRGPSRRDIGHGALAERALLPMIPSIDEFPYTIRVVSEVLESNGSSSQGSVCGSTLALMDAGVPIKAPVSGIAMGLVKEGEKYVILSDIQGMEDYLGDMDFKVAGTAKGITALQMDIKIGGVNQSILTEALQQAYEGRMHIMEIMLQT